ncbi:MAG: 5'-methylthioadenosine/adenosylhomocysteine nucleosidase [Oscillospiraceae bacterium]|nr:5'-methylthioadenosine/adenosylhomocysteine nucleosidase [Oscillospiraceae bacterium]
MKIIGIIGAMPSELKDIQNHQEHAVITELAGYSFHESMHGVNKIITVCCGIGKVNAAVCTQILIDVFKAEQIINTGIAGGMKAGIKVLEIVISSSVLHHDLDAHFLADYPPCHAEFEADKALQDLAKSVCQEMNIIFHSGKIVSGDAFITDSEIKKNLIQKYDPCAVDMETAAVGQTAWRNEIPFVSVRCISDLADDEGAMSFDEFEVLAAQRVAEIVMTMCERE